MWVGVCIFCCCANYFVIEMSYLTFSFCCTLLFLLAVFCVDRISYSRRYKKGILILRPPPLSTQLGGNTYSEGALDYFNKYNLPENAGTRQVSIRQYV